MIRSRCSLPAKQGKCQSDSKHGNSIGAMEEGQRRFVSQALRKASTFGRFQFLRSAHKFRSVACDAAALGMQSPSIHVDSTSLKPSELAFGTHEKKSIGALEWVRVGASSHILQAKSEEMPQVQCKGEGRSVSHSIGAMEEGERRFGSQVIGKKRALL